MAAWAPERGEHTAASGWAARAADQADTILRLAPRRCQTYKRLSRVWPACLTPKVAMKVLRSDFTLWREADDGRLCVRVDEYHALADCLSHRQLWRLGLRSDGSRAQMRSSEAVQQDDDFEFCRDPESAPAVSLPGQFGPLRLESGGIVVEAVQQGMEVRSVEYHAEIATFAPDALASIGIVDFAAMPPNWSPARHWPLSADELVVWQHRFGFDPATADATRQDLLTVARWLCNDRPSLGALPNALQSGELSRNHHNYLWDPRQLTADRVAHVVRQFPDDNPQVTLDLARWQGLALRRPGDFPFFRASPRRTSIALEPTGTAFVEPLLGWLRQGLAYRGFDLSNWGDEFGKALLPADRDVWATALCGLAENDLRNAALRLLLDAKEVEVVWIQSR